MSFLERIESEIALNGKKYNKSRLHFIYGLVFFSKSIDKDRVIIESNNKDIVLMILGFFKSEFSIEPFFLEKTSVFSLRLKNAQDYNMIKEKLANKNFLLTFTNEGRIETENEHISFLAATFLACGSISEPKKGYHLEFSAGKHENSIYLNNILLKLDLPSKIAVRKNNRSSVYIRDSSGVEDFLTFIGASNSAMEIMKIKIVKDVRNRVNREINFETANIKRTANAYAEQVFDIQYIIDNGQIDNLTEDLKKTIDIRSAYPDLSLKDLGEQFDPKISRSAVNYRLQKIRKYANQLRKEKKG